MQSLDLDARQRAMLLEMGVRVWQPLSPDSAASDQVAVEAATQPTIPAANPSQGAAIAPRAAAPRQAAREIPPRVAPGPDAANGVALDVHAMDGPALLQAAAQCQACGLCAGRKNTTLAMPDPAVQADWLVVGDPPDEDEDRQGQPFVEQAGQLLDNMLKAVGVSRWGPGNSGATAAYLTNVVKCRPAVVRNPQPQELAVCENYLRREVALVQPKVILVLGRFAAQSLLRERVPEVSAIPLGKLRGQIYRYQGIPVVVSYHPAYLLRSQGDKARAWADLCLALSLLKPVAA